MVDKNGMGGRKTFVKRGRVLAPTQQLGNPIKIDPTRTITLRRVFASEMAARFNIFKKQLIDIVGIQDEFGLGDNNEAVQANVALLSNILNKRELTQVQNARFGFLSSSDKILAFAKLVQEAIANTILDSNKAKEDAWWNKYIREGYQKGAGRAFDDFSKANGDKLKHPLDFYRGTRHEFLSSSFNQPVSVERVKVLASRVFTELKGVTDAMAQNLSRQLVDGLVQGKSPRAVAKDIADVVDGIGRKRAELIARTETIRAHAEGQLDGLEGLGVESVGVAVEWATSGLNVCPLCSDMQGVVLSIAEARGMIPRHPNCMCSFIPANVGESKKGQIRSKTDIRKAIDKSVKDESPKSKLSIKQRRERSGWAGATRSISKIRPVSILDEE